jgi:multidrug efflux pump subunit AcrA (membrane-fusion protein)
MNLPTATSTDPQANSNGSVINLPLPKAHEPAAGIFHKLKPYLWLGGILGVVIFAVAVFAITKYGIREPYTGPTFTVARQILKATVVERGSLESAENSDITCRVQARTKGSTIATTIKWVIDDGTVVKAGDPVVELDDSGFQESLKSQRNTVNKSFAEWIKAKTGHVTVQVQNESDIKSAEVVLNLAELDFEKFVGKIAAPKIMPLKTRAEMRKYLEDHFENDVSEEVKLRPDRLPNQYLQKVNEIKGRIAIAQSEKETWADRSSWSQGMVRLGYYSLSQADADQSRLTSADIALRKVQGELDIYGKYELEREVTKLWSDFKEAERSLKRVIEVAELKLEQARAEEKAMRLIHEQEIERLRDMEKEERFYRIPAPQGGLVVYHISEQSRFSSGSQQSTIAQGEPVREGQKLIRIPNLNRMLVNARVHEAMVLKVKGERTRPTGTSDLKRLVFGLGRQDLFAFAYYQSAFEIAREEFTKDIKDKEQELIFEGHEAFIRVDAYPGVRYKGRVKSVATVASQSDFLSSDVKVYQTMVSIDNLDERVLKPGMSAEVTILVEESPTPVLVVPIQAVIGNVSMGADRKCFVLDERGYPQERDIKLGMSNAELVEIKDGLQPGEKVVLNPKPFIADRSDMKAGSPSTRRSEQFEEGGQKGGKKADGKGPPTDKGGGKGGGKKKQQ